MNRLALLLPAAIASASVLAQPLPPLTDDLLKQAGAALHVDVKTGRMAGVGEKGPIAEVGAKIVEVIHGDYAADEWIAWTKPVEGEYVKPNVSQRLVVMKKDGYGAPLVDAEYSQAARDTLVKQIGDYRRKNELLTGEMHVPDYLLRSQTNALVYVDVKKTAPYDRGKGYLSATHTATVIASAQGDLKPGQTVEYIEESNRRKRFDAPANPKRIVLLTYTRSVQDGQMKWWLHERVNYGYTEAGFKALEADAARVRAKQAEKKN